MMRFYCHINRKNESTWLFDRDFPDVIIIITDQLIISSMQKECLLFIWFLLL